MPKVRGPGPAALGWAQTGVLRPNVERGSLVRRLVAHHWVAHRQGPALTASCPAPLPCLADEDVSGELEGEHFGVLSLRTVYALLGVLGSHLEGVLG